MAYLLRNRTAGVDRRCPTLKEALRTVNEIVSDAEEWLIVELADETPGAEVVVASGQGAIMRD